MRTVAVLLALSAHLQQAIAADIADGPAMRLSGLHTFTAMPTVPGASVRWWVHRRLVLESSGTQTIDYFFDSANGSSAQFNIIKLSNRYTYFHIYAEDNGIVDSTVVQAFAGNIANLAVYEGPNNVGKPIRVFTVVPSSFGTNTRMVFVMHGTNRNADDYIASWQTFATTNNYIACAPEFNSTDWPGSASYHQGNMFTGSNGAGTPIPEARWTFSLVHEIQRWIQEGFGMADTTFDIFGHSAGSQFTHRMMFFKPSPRIRFAFPANAGAYTAPDLAVTFQYGLSHPTFNFTVNDLVTYTNRKLVVMRGTADTLRDSQLPTGTLPDAQGRNRFERAAYFYTMGRGINPQTPWELIDVPGVGHSQSGMAPAAQAYLLAHPTLVHERAPELFPPFPTLAQNYPNPFNPSTTIEYTTAREGRVTLVIFTLLGEEVRRLVDMFVPAGNHRTTFGADGLASGMYLYQLKTTEGILTRRMVLVR